MAAPLIEELILALRQAGDDGFDGPKGASLFRIVEEKMEDCFVHIDPTEIPPEIFSVYLFVEHIFSILTGDVRYHKKSESLCCQVFNSLGVLLTQLAALLQGEGGANDRFCLAYSDTVRLYLQNSRKINELIAEKM